MYNKLIKTILLLAAAMLPGVAFADAFDTIDKVHLDPGDTAKYWPIYVYAVGDLVKEVLEVVAILVNTSDFITFNVIVLLLGLILVGVKNAVQFDAKTISTFFLGAVFFSYATVWSKADVVVYDQYNHTGGPGWYVVNDVPALVAVPVSGITSAIHGLQEVIATNFSLPNGGAAYSDFSVAAKGYNFLGTVIKDSTNITITNPHIKSSFEDYYAQCVTYDIYNGVTSPSSLIASNNILADIASTNESRLTPYYDPVTGAETMETCKGAYDGLVAAMDATEAAEWANSSMPSLGYMSNVGIVSTDAIQGAYAALGSSGTGTNIAIQHALVNGLQDAYEHSATITGVNEMALAINTEQAKTSQISGWITAAEVFSDIVVYLLGGLQALVFALLPIVLAFIAVPSMGVKIVGSAFKIILWLALWPLGLEIINFLAVHVQTSQLLASVDVNGATASTIVGLRDSSAKMAMVFSLIATLIPMLLYSLINGGEFSMTEALSKGLGTDQGKAAGAAAAKGDVSYDNTKSNSVSAGKYDTQVSQISGINKAQHTAGSGLGVMNLEKQSQGALAEAIIHDGDAVKFTAANAYQAGMEVVNAGSKALMGAESEVDSSVKSKIAASQNSFRNGYGTSVSERMGREGKTMWQVMNEDSSALGSGFARATSYGADSSDVHKLSSTVSIMGAAVLKNGGKAIKDLLKKKDSAAVEQLKKEGGYSDEEAKYLHAAMKKYGGKTDEKSQNALKRSVDEVNMSKVQRDAIMAQTQKDVMHNYGIKDEGQAKAIADVLFNGKNASKASHQTMKNLYGKDGGKYKEYMDNPELFKKHLDEKYGQKDPAWMKNVDKTLDTVAAVSTAAMLVPGLGWGAGLLGRGASVVGKGGLWAARLASKKNKMMDWSKTTEGKARLEKAKSGLAKGAKGLGKIGGVLLNGLDAKGTAESSESFQTKESTEARTKNDVDKGNRTSTSRTNAEGTSWSIDTKIDKAKAWDATYTDMNQRQVSTNWSRENKYVEQIQKLETYKQGLSADGKLGISAYASKDEYHKHGKVLLNDIRQAAGRFTNEIGGPEAFRDKVEFTDEGRPVVNASDVGYGSSTHQGTGMTDKPQEGTLGVAKIKQGARVETEAGAKKGMHVFTQVLDAMNNFSRGAVGANKVGEVLKDLTDANDAMGFRAELGSALASENKSQMLQALQTHKLEGINGVSAVYRRTGDDGTHYFMTQDKEGNPQKLATYDPDSGNFIPLSSAERAAVNGGGSLGKARDGILVNEGNAAAELNIKLANPFANGAATNGHVIEVVTGDQPFAPGTQFRTPDNREIAVNDWGQDVDVRTGEIVTRSPTGLTTPTGEFDKSQKRN